MTIFPDREIDLDSYSVVRLDRNQHGGGVTIYISLLFTYNIFFSGNSSFECITVLLTINFVSFVPVF